MATITVPTKSHSKKLFIAAGGALAALAVATGIGAWQYTNHDSGTRPAVVASVPLTAGDTSGTALTKISADERADARAQAAGAAASSAATARPQEVPALYIVATEAEAMALRAEFEAFGPAPRPFQVLVLAPADDDGQRLTEYNHLREVNGLWPVELIDLRGR